MRETREQQINNVLTAYGVRQMKECVIYIQEGELLLLWVEAATYMYVTRWCGGWDDKWIIVQCSELPAARSSVVITGVYLLALCRGSQTK